MSARRPPPDREDEAGPRAWSAADEEWFAGLLDAAPPLSERQRDRLRELLDLSASGASRDTG